MTQCHFWLIPIFLSCDRFMLEPLNKGETETENKP